MVPDRQAVMSDRPENATHTTGITAAGKPTLDGVMICPQDV